MKRLVWTLLALFVAATVSAQSLAEIARKEKERRKKLGSTHAETYTESDLRSSEGPMTQVTGQPASGEEETTGEEGAEPEGAEGPEGEAPEDPAQTQEYWRNRVSTIDQRIRDLETRLQSPQFTSNPRGATQRQALEGELEQARADRRAVEEEARRAGVPPGWLR